MKKSLCFVFFILFPFAIFAGGGAFIYLDNVGDYITIDDKEKIEKMTEETEIFADYDGMYLRIYVNQEEVFSFKTDVYDDKITDYKLKEHVLENGLTVNEYKIYTDKFLQLFNLHNDQIFNFINTMFKDKNKISFEHTFPLGINGIMLNRIGLIIEIDETTLYFIDLQEPWDGYNGRGDFYFIEQMGVCTLINNEALKKELYKSDVIWEKMECGSYTIFFSSKEYYDNENYGDKVWYLGKGNKYYKFAPSEYNDIYYKKYSELLRNKEVENTYNLFGLE